MNDSCRQREELLRMARQMERKSAVPAVHPKYRHIYKGLYESSSAQDSSGSNFFVRMFISFLLFSMFVAADYTEEKIWKYTPEQIVSQIEYQPDLFTLK